MNTRSYPRSSVQAFPKHTDYACAVERAGKRKDRAAWVFAIALLAWLAWAVMNHPSV